MYENDKNKIIAIANQKGGVGKTTTSVNLATALAALGNKTLLIDLDPQGNATTGFDMKAGITIYELLIDSNCNISEAILPTKIKNLDMITSGINLSGAELELASLQSREYKLSSIIKKLTHYSYIIIDCPPSLGLLTINAMVAANNLLIPMQCEFYSLDGLSNLLRTIKLLKKNLNKNLSIAGILLTMYDKRNKLTEQVENDVRKYLGDLVFKTTIPRNVRVSEAPSHGLPVIIYDHRSPGALAYVELAKEILKKGRLQCQ
jgi:chromosome partitioning protein